jgi:hypothetical protein
LNVLPISARDGSNGDLLLAQPATAIIPHVAQITMPTPANLFRLLSEFIVLLLGALLIVLAVSGRVGLPGRPAALVVLGIVLIYWGVRAWVRPGVATHRLQPRIRAGGLVLVGFLVLGIRYVPLRDAELFLGIAGAVLVFRGLLGVLLFARQK